MKSTLLMSCVLWGVVSGVSARSASAFQIPGVDVFQDNASGSTCDLVNATSDNHDAIQLVVLSATDTEPRQLALVTGQDVTLGDSLVDTDNYVYFGGSPFGRIAFLEDGDGNSTLWWVDAFDNAIGLDPTTYDPFTTQDSPLDFVSAGCDACQYWDNDVDCPGSPETTRITVQPQGGTFCIGKNITLAIQAVGRHIADYQWYKNGVILVGETDNALLLTNVDENDQAYYQCLVIDDDAGITESDSVSIIITDCSGTPTTPGLNLCGASIVPASLVGLVTLFALQPLTRRRRRGN